MKSIYRSQYGVKSEVFGDQVGIYHMCSADWLWFLNKSKIVGHCAYWMFAVILHIYKMCDY